MHRKSLGITLAILAALVLVGTQAGQGQDKKSVSVKVLVPQTSAKVTIDGTDYKGEGDERQLKVPVTGKEIVVSAMWNPNGYTEIVRTKKVALTNDKEVVADLRKADEKNPDKIKVIYVPTPQDVVEAMCKMAKVGKDDVVYDLGCGDARMVITAVKQFSAKKGVGVDIRPEQVKESQENVKKAGVEKTVEIRQGDVLDVRDLSDATVVLLYMGDDINNRLKPILQKTLKPGSRVVSHRFLMGDDWKPLRSEKVQSSSGYECELHLWIIEKPKS